MSNLSSKEKKTCCLLAEEAIKQDVKYDYLLILTICENYIIRTASITEVCYSAITDVLIYQSEEIIHLDNLSFPSSQLHVMDETHVINQVKEDVCYVSQQFYKDMEIAQ